MDLLTMDFEKLLDVANSDPKKLVQLFSETNWVVDDGMKKHMTDIISFRKIFTNPTQLDYDTAIAVNSILAVRCHRYHVNKFIDENSWLKGVSVEWVLVVHEYDTGTIFYEDSKTGKIIYAPQYPDLFNGNRLIHKSFVGDTGFEHRLIFNPHN